MLPLLESKLVTVMVYQCVRSRDDDATQTEEKRAHSEPEVQIWGDRASIGSARQKMTRLLDEYELLFYARSFHNAAKALVASFQPNAGILPEADACPVSTG